MWLWLMAGWLAGQTPPATAPVSPQAEALEREVERLFSEPATPALSCQAAKYPARLGYDFRYWSGIDFEVGLGQMAPLATGARLWLVLRVTPQGRKARYFTQMRYLPSAKQLPPGTDLKKILVHLGGGVYLGEGKYKMEALLIDEKDRRCKKDWSVEAKHVGQPLRIEPLTAEMGRGRGRATAPAAEPRERIAAVLMLDSLGPRQHTARLNGWERAALTGSLFSLIDSRPEAEFSLDVVHVESRRVLYSTPRFDSRSVEPLMRALRDLDLAIVDYGSLQKGAKAAFFANFVEKQTESWANKDAVIFLGPAWRWGEKIPESLKRRQERSPKFVHLALGPPFLPPEDVAKQFVAAQDGRILRVGTPVDLARALKKLWSNDLVNRVANHIADVGRDHARAREGAR